MDLSMELSSEPSHEHSTWPVMILQDVMVETLYVRGRRRVLFCHDSQTEHTYTHIAQNAEI
jgi:hypothetical protein